MITIQIEGLDKLLTNLFSKTIFSRNPPTTVQTVEEPELQTIEEPAPSEDLGELNPPKRGRGRPKKEATPEPAVEPTPEPKPVSVREDLLQDASTEAKASTPPADKPKSGKLTKEDATRVGAGVMRTHGPAALKNILQSLGVERASLLSEEQIPEFVEMCEMLE